jgi:hypothetical protein
MRWRGCQRHGAPTIVLATLPSRAQQRLRAISSPSRAISGDNLQPFSGNLKREPSNPLS